MYRVRINSTGDLSPVRDGTTGGNYRTGNPAVPFQVNVLPEDTVFHNAFLPDNTVGADHHIGANHRPGAHPDIRAQIDRAPEDRGLINLGFA